ncbi:MAG TPA: DUF3261 domain-containing protein [Candidatus Binatia bacterium]|nr:DUF3261 domain-containing protein [Candidatus Binatia bacterium]
MQDHRLLRSFALVLVALSLGGCTALRPLVAPGAHQCPWIELDPSMLAGPARQELRARVTASGVDHAFTLAVERSEEALVLVGLTPLGTKSFEAQRRSDRTRVTNHLGLAAVVPPRNVVADMSAVLAASPCTASSQSEAVAELGRWTITDTCSAGRVVRRHVRGPGQVGNVDISYKGNEAMVVQHDCGYEALYITVATGTGSGTENAVLGSGRESEPRAGRPPAPAETSQAVALPPPAAAETSQAVALPPRAAAEASQPAAPLTPAAAGPPMSSDTSQPAVLTITPAIRAIVGDIDRSDEDIALDAGRRPEELLAFLQVEPGMRVAELGAGGGYTAELLARAVGPSGTVYAQNSRFILERFAEKPWSERLTKPVMRKVVRVDREFSDPLPPQARDLDLVVMNLFYHDTVWMKADRDAMNRAILRSLRPGGRFVVIDHSARAGRGVQDVESLHRIEESVVRGELLRAGFRLTRHAEFLRNPADARDWNDSPRAAGERRGTSDRFVLEFVKPRR